MNLFSQSKLTLKLKKPNNASTDFTNNCQKPEVSEFSKSQHLSNSSMISASDSFVEILQTVQSDDEITTKSSNVFKASDFSSDQNPSNFVNENKPCPICTQLVDVKNFITHVKSCGTSYNLSSETLIKAVDLQERQTAEREALGLPKLSKSSVVKKKKPNTIKQTKPKVGSDANLDLAIAMSMSLQESKEAEIIKESEIFIEAGLENEAMERRKTLENFGFISNQPMKSKAKNFSKTNSLLFKQTKEDREKRITEKVAMILIDSDKSSEILVNDCPNITIRSKYLNGIRNFDNKLWKKSLLEEDMYKFYVENLSKFIKPCQNYCDSGLKLVYLSPVHQNTSIHEQSTNNKEYDAFHKIEKTSNYSYSIQNKTMSEYSSKWKSMLGNQFMSDITIYSKDEHEIPVHSLVLFAQCPDILDDVITEELNTSKTKKMIMWLEYSYEACFSFLELIYSGQEPCISPEYRDEYLNLGTRYNILMTVNNDDKLGWVSSDKLLKRKSPNISNSPVDCKRYKASSPDLFSSDDISVKNEDFNFLGVNVNDEISLSVLKTKQWLDSCNRSQQNPNSSFTENLLTDVSSQIILPKKSPSHSFHSASTKSLHLSPNYNGDNIVQDDHDTLPSLPLDSCNYPLPKSLSTNKLNIKTTSMEQNNKDMSNISTTHLTKDSTLTNAHEEPELIIVDSESESLDIIFPSCKKEPCTSINNVLNKNGDSYLSQSQKHNFSLNLSDIKCANFFSTIEITDSSSDSDHSASTKRLKSKNKSIHHSSFSSTRNKTINIENEPSIFSKVTNVFPTNNFDKISNVNVIDLVDNSSNLLSEKTIINDKSMSVHTSLNNVQKSYKNPAIFSSVAGREKYFASNSNTKINTNCDMNSVNFFSSTNLFRGKNNLKSGKQNNKTHVQIHDVENNDDKHNSNLETNLMPTTYTSKVITRNETELHFPPNNITLNKTISVPVEPVEIFDSINTSKITTPNKNNYELGKSVSEEMINDPWMDYWEPIDISPRYVSSVLLESLSVVSVDASDVQTPNRNNVQPVDLDLQTPTIIPSHSGKKNSGTPNKYGSRINTPKSLRRVQSESAIEYKNQVTPLPDYSAMKTPDLRKEFDRYGLKDLGRRKGKLILRHIYDVLHPMFSSKEDACTTEVEQYSSDSSDNSDHGIPDYEGENHEELETFSQTSLSNKTSMEIGFKQLLKVNEDLHEKILCYEPIWIEELKECLKQYNVNISMQKLMTFLDDKCVTFRSKSLNDQRQKTLAKKNTKRKKLF